MPMPATPKYSRPGIRVSRAPSGTDNPRKNGQNFDPVQVWAFDRPGAPKPCILSASLTLPADERYFAPLPADRVPPYKTGDSNIDYLVRDGLIPEELTSTLLGTYSAKLA